MMTRVRPTRNLPRHTEKYGRPYWEYRESQSGTPCTGQPCLLHNGQSTPTLDNPSDGFEALSNSYHTGVDSRAAEGSCMDAMCPTSSGLAVPRVKLLIAPKLSTNQMEVLQASSANSCWQSPCLLMA